MSQILNGAINIKDGMTAILDKISKKLKNMSQQMPTMINGIDKAVGSMSSKLKNHEANIAAHQNRMLNNMRRNQEKFIQYIHRTPREIERANARMAGKARAFGMHQQNISMGLAAAGLPGAYMAYKGAKSFAEFDQVMADLRAKTLDSFAESYKRQAISLGMSSRYSPSEIGKAQIILAKAGYQGDKLLKTAPSVINMASANDMSMEDAASAMIAAKNTFQIGDDIASLNKVVDMLSYTANKTNSDVKDLITSMNYSGATAKSFGMTLEENLFFSGKLKDFGMSASTVGTSMNQFIERLLANSDAQDVLKKKLGVDIYQRDNKGNPLYRKNIFEIIEGIRVGMQKVNIEQGPKIMKDLAETRGFRAISRIASIDPKELEKARQEFMDYEKIKGYASQMEKERLKSYTGQLEKLKSGLDSVSISIGQLVTDFGLFKWLIDTTQKFEDFTNLFLDYNKALDVANGNIEVAKLLLGNNTWGDALDFIVGFRQGIDDVVQTFKDIYNETMKFIGVMNGGNMQSLGRTIAHIGAFSAVLTPLGLGMLFIKNITMGLYSSFAFLGTAMMHASEGISKVRNLFNKPEEIIDSLAGSNTSRTSNKSSKTSKKQLAMNLVNEVVDINNNGKIGVSDSADFYDVNGHSIGDLSKLTKSHNIEKIVENAVATSTGLGSASIASRMSSKSMQGGKIINDIEEAIGATSIGAMSGFGGATESKGKFGSNKVAKAADKINDMADTISDMPGISDNLAQKKTKHAIENIVEMSSAIGAGTSAQMIPHLPLDVTSLSDGVSDNTIVNSSGIGNDSVHDEQKKRTLRDKIKHGTYSFGGFLGSLGDNYLTAGLFGSTKAKDALKKGFKNAGSKIPSIKNIIPNIKLAAMVAAESLLPDLDFGGGKYDTDENGKKKFKKGKDIRKSMLSAKVSPGIDLLKGGFSSFLSAIPAAMSMLGTFITTVLSPFALILGSIAVIGAALFLMLKKDGESWGEMFGRILKNITDTAMFLWTEVFVPFGQGLAEVFAPTIKMIQEAFVAMGERLTPMFKRIAAMFSGSEEGGLGKNMKYIGEIAGWALNRVLLPAINLIITAIELLVGLLGDVVELFTSLATGNFSNFGRTLFRMFARVITGIFQLLATAVGSIIQMIPGMDSYGTEFIEWSRKNIDADSWTNAIFGDNRVNEEVMLKEEAKKQKEYIESMSSLTASNNAVYGDEYGDSSSPLEEITSSFDTGDAETNAEIERQAREKDAKENNELLKKIAKNTGDPCDTNLDGKKISKNQERHQAINRMQGGGRLTPRTSKQQGRFN